ncbi:MAG TPA: hypothetical protein DCF49_07955 [Lachnospiraceae bacterium]|jgi:hypothetical protein|nr:hypothetical protein [Lachnospiraceae bacterium]
MSKALHDYLDFCSLFRGGYFFANMNAVLKTAYWTAVFLTIGLTILVTVAFVNADDKSSAGRAIQVYLASVAAATALFGIEVPFLVLLMSFGMRFLLKRN